MRAALVVFASILVLAARPIPLSAQQYAGPSTRFIGFSPVRPPGNNLDFRKALCFAVDREKVATSVAGLIARAQSAYSIQHPDLVGHDPSFRPCSYDPAKARQFFARSNEVGVALLVGPNPSPAAQKFNDAVAENIQNSLGTSVVIRPVDTRARSLFEQEVRGEVSVYISSWTSDGRDFGHPSMALSLAERFMAFDPELKAMVDKALPTKDGREVERYLVEVKTYMVPILFYIR